MLMFGMPGIEMSPGFCPGLQAPNHLASIIAEDSRMSWKGDSYVLLMSALYAESNWPVNTARVFAVLPSNWHVDSATRFQKRLPVPFRSPHKKCLMRPTPSVEVPLGRQNSVPILEIKY
jgi:hypothetical protein